MGNSRDQFRFGALDCLQQPTDSHRFVRELEGHVLRALLYGYVSGTVLFNEFFQREG